MYKTSKGFNVDFSDLASLIQNLETVYDKPNKKTQYTEQKSNFHTKEYKDLVNERIKLKQEYEDSLNDYKKYINELLKENLTLREKNKELSIQLDEFSEVIVKQEKIIKGCQEYATTHYNNPFYR